MALFSIVNPLAAIPVFAGVTADLPQGARRKLPRKMALATVPILARSGPG